MKPEDYREPVCPLCMKDPEKEHIEKIDCSRMTEKLDSYLAKNDYEGAKRHLLYWLAEAENGNDKRGKLSVLNELMGLYRKMRMEQESIDAAQKALKLSEELEIGETVASGTTLLNAATVYKAFGKAEKALPLYEEAKKNYEANLEQGDTKFGGLYNNMGLAYADLKMFDEALSSFENALKIMSSAENGGLESAITYLNMANMYEQRDGLENAAENIELCLDKAETLISDKALPRNGYYAFVCDKCQGTFRYYGRFGFADDLVAVSEEIYRSNT